MKKTPLAKVVEHGAGGGKPPVTDPPAPVKAEEDTPGLKKLFADLENTPESEKKEEPPKPKEEPPPPPPVPEPEKKEETPKGDEETPPVDFEKLPEGSEHQQRESAAQIRARENGKALEALRTEHENTKLELERIRGELDIAKKGAEVQQHVRESDFVSHPDVSPMIRQVASNRDALAEVQDFPEAGQLIKGKFGGYMIDYLAKGAMPEAEARAADSQLRTRIADDFREAYRTAKGEDLDEDEMNREAKSFTREVIQLLVSNASTTAGIQEKISSLAAKAREGNLAKGVEVYQFHHTDLKTVLAAAADIPDKVIDDNPHTVEATVAALLKQPPWKKRWEQSEATVLEMLLGPQVLTQAEMDRMAAGGVPVKEFEKRRQKKWLDDRRALVPKLARALMLLPLWEENARKAALYDDSQGELDAASKGKPKSGDPQPKPEPEKNVTRESFVSASEEFLKGL